MKHVALIASSVLVFVLLAVGVANARRVTAPTPRAVEHNNRGAKLLNEERLAEAELELKTAVELSPDYSEAYNNLGILYKKRNQLDLAMEHFKKAVELNPSYASAYNHIAAVHLTRGEFDKAIEYANKALKKEPTFADAVYNKGLALFLKGRAELKPVDRKKLYDEASIEFSKATQLNPKLTIAHKNMGDLYTELGNYEQAAIRYRLALEDNPNSAETWEQLASVYRLMGDNAKAQNAASKAREVAKANRSSDNYSAGMKTLTAGEEKLAAGDKKGANASFNQAVKSFAEALLADPKSANAAYQLGLTYHRLGEKTMAKKSWQQAISLEPNHAGALYNLGTLLSLEGATTESAAHLCRFLAVAGKQFPAEAQTVRQRLHEQGLSCRK